MAEGNAELSILIIYIPSVILMSYENSGFEMERLDLSFQTVTITQT